MTRDEAMAEATRRNRELAQRGESDGFYVEVERASGEWSVARREQRPRWFERLVRRIMEAMPPQP